MADTSTLWLAVSLLHLAMSALTSQDMSIDCTTPSGAHGFCIHLADCTALRELLNSGYPASIEVLRKFTCGFDKAVPKVCCPEENSLPINFPNDTETATGGSRTPTTTTVTRPLSFPPKPPPPSSANAQFPLRTTTYVPPTSYKPQSPTRPNKENPTTQKVQDVNHSTTIRTTLLPIHNEPTNGPDHAVDNPSDLNWESQHNFPAANVLPDTNTCGIITLENKIYGGENTSIEEFPWLTLLIYKVASKDQFGCSGVLINHRYVLTAAHCIRTPNSYTLSKVRLGEHNVQTEVDCQEFGCNAPPLDLDVEQVIVHPDFDLKNLTNDIALIRLASNVNYSEWVQPICLPDSQDRDYTEQSFWVAGWGQTESGKPSPVKLKLEERFLDLDTCSAAYRKLNLTLGPGHICAGGRSGQDTCAGDSGGPLMRILTQDLNVNFFTVGIVSLGPSRCGLEGWAGVYTKVSYYSNWIRSSLRP